jgi:hypothetical protein
MPYPIYKLIHYLGIFTVVIAVALVCMHVLRGGTRADYPHRRALAIAHGTAMVLVLLGGFGMLARLEYRGIPGWLYPKLLIWLFLGASTALAYRNRAFARMLLVALPVIAVLAAYFALYKPF